MTAATDTERLVDTRAVIFEANGDITLRRNGDDGIFVKPHGLDGDGEFHLTVASLGEALRVLGINRADMYPDG